MFGKKQVRLLLKWSKTMQTRDKAKVITLPRLDSDICPYRALKGVFQMYQPGGNDPLFQIQVGANFQVVSDSRVRKMLAMLTEAMGFPKTYFIFHTFRRSGATLAYKNRVPIEDIQQHGTWTSDCDWRYILFDVDAGTKVSSRFCKILS